MTIQAAAASCDMLPGVRALPGGLLLLLASQTLIAADAHLAYEDAIGAALPLWSTAQSVDDLDAALVQTGARELVLLGDIVHTSALNDGAAVVVARALDRLRARATLTLVAGNHEGRTRGRTVLGHTHEAVERDGWLLIHGDTMHAATRTIIGHLHPSMPVGSGARVPAFLACDELVVVPALTTYSRGLNVFSRDCARAVASFGADIERCSVVASDATRVYPFGTVGELRPLMVSGRPLRYRKRSSAR